MSGVSYELANKSSAKANKSSAKANKSGLQGTVGERDQCLIDECMDWFDFETVHRVMTHMDWHWGPSGGVPSLPVIRKTSRRILLMAVLGGNGHAEDGLYGIRTGSGDFMAGSGGFVARYHTYTESEPSLHLAFEMESWDAGDD